MTWLLVMTFCAVVSRCEDVPIDSFKSQVECEEALGRAINKQQMTPTKGIDNFFCRQDGEMHASLLLVHQPEQSWWWKNYPCGMVNPSTNFEMCKKPWASQGYRDWLAKVDAFHRSHRR